MEQRNTQKPHSAMSDKYWKLALLSLFFFFVCLFFFALDDVWPCIPCKP